MQTSNHQLLCTRPLVNFTMSNVPINPQTNSRNAQTNNIPTNSRTYHEDDNVSSASTIKIGQQNRYYYQVADLSKDKYPRIINIKNKYGIKFEVNMLCLTHDVYLWMDLDQTFKFDIKPSIKNIPYLEKIKYFPYFFTKAEFQSQLKGSFIDLLNSKNSNIQVSVPTLKIFKQASQNFKKKAQNWPYQLISPIRSTLRSMYGCRIHQMPTRRMS